MNEANTAMSAKPWSDGIYQEVDGLFYYEPPSNRGCYSAYALCKIADLLDEMNKPLLEQIERDLLSSSS